MLIKISKIIAASPNTDRGRPTQLSADPKGEQLAYASGKSIFLRSIDDPSLSKQYTSHISQTTVARFSPSGYYVASGDVSGMVKVWDAVEAINTKGEYHIISGRINDIAWDHESKRLIAVGDGRERFGHCITADSGNSVGEISGHSSIVNSVSIRQQRPLKAATGADDHSLVFLNGVPFKFANKLGHLHKGYIYGVSFSPDGNKLVSVGADRKIQLYDGKTGEPEVQIGNQDHQGSIFGVSWADDSKRFVTASADRTVRLWDVETSTAVQTWDFNFEKDGKIQDQQVGIVWPATRSDGMIISLNLAGDLNYLVEGSRKPIRVVQGHNRSITAFGSTQEEDHQTFWSGSFDGRVCSWDASSGTCTATGGESHKNQVTAFQTSSGKAYSVGWDDKLRTADVNTKSYIGEGLKLAAQPKGIATAEGRLFIASATGIEVFCQESMEIVHRLMIKNFTPSAIAALDLVVAIGDDSGHVHIYKVDSSYELHPQQVLKLSSAQITALSFSSGGNLLAVGNSSGKIVVYETKSWEIKTDRWSAHTARVTSIAWNAEGSLAVSGGLDTNIFVWSLKSPGERVKVSNAHKDGVSGLSWVDGDKKVVSAGGDAALKFWDVSDIE